MSDPKPSLASTEPQDPPANGAVADAVGSPASSEAAPPPPDGPEGWIVVAAAFLVHFVVFGWLYSFGLFVLPIAAEFNESRSLVALVGSVSVGTMLFFAVLVGAWVDKYGCRRILMISGISIALAALSASYVEEFALLLPVSGVLGGIAFSCGFVPAITSVQTWFLRRRGTATGIAVAGSGLGNFVFALALRPVIDAYGWRTTFRSVGVAVGAGVALTAPFLSMRLDRHRTKHSAPKAPRPLLPPRAVLLDRRLIVLCIGRFLGAMGYSTPFIHIAAFASDSGLSDGTGALALALLGLSSTSGRVVMGAVADRIGHLRVLLISEVFLGVSSLLWPLCTTEWSLVLFALVFGFHAGAWIAVTPAFCAHMFAESEFGAYLSSIVGVTYFAAALPTIVGPVVAGAMFDSTGSYTAAGIYTGLFMLAEAVLLGTCMPKSAFEYQHVKMLTSLSADEATALEQQPIGLARSTTAASETTGPAVELESAESDAVDVESAERTLATT